MYIIDVARDISLHQEVGLAMEGEWRRLKQYIL
jgi:hypothetical protein